MFKPTEIIFVPTAQCNLHCKHCYVSRNNAEYDIKFALNFIEDCAQNKIDRISFSGGEPFLNLDFVIKICEKAVEKEMFFGNLMTNGVWWKDEFELKEKLDILADSGFDGKIAVSFDKFHGQNIEKITKFIEIVSKIFQYDNSLGFVCVRDGDDEKTREMLKNFKKISVDWIDFIPQDFNDEKFWQSEKWLKDDFCKGPGNIFYVHNNGDIACCCGYANEEKELILGNITTHNFVDLMKNAEENEFVKIVYESGFEREIAELERRGKVFGKTDKHCLFCRKLIELRRKK
jgi:MoaA/NifB/PqqE/SkfB family radical SAM enzyme